MHDLKKTSRRILLPLVAVVISFFCLFWANESFAADIKPSARTPPSPGETPPIPL